MDIVTISCPHKKNITKNFLEAENLKYIESITPDVPLDTTHIKEEYLPFNQNLLGAYRCHYAHKLAVSRSEEDYSLILEDDAIPLVKSWHSICLSLIDDGFLEEYDFCLLHLRQARPENQFYSEPGYTMVDRVMEQNIIKPIRWGLGSLAYIVGPKGKELIKNSNYEGLPMDLWLVNDTDYVWLKDPDLFAHERIHGSVVENAS